MKKKNEKQIANAEEFKNSLSAVLAGLMPGAYGLGLAFGSTQVSQVDTFFKNNRWYLISNMRQVLSEIYVEHGIVQTLVDLPVDDGFRGGITIKSEQLDEDELADLEKFFVRSGATLDIYGGTFEASGSGSVTVTATQGYTATSVPENPAVHAPSGVACVYIYGGNIISTSTDGFCVRPYQGGKAVIYGGTFEAPNGSTVVGAGESKSHGYVYVYGGTFVKSATTGAGLLNNGFNTESANWKNKYYYIYGGTFYTAMITDVKGYRSGADSMDRYNRAFSEVVYTDTEFNGEATVTQGIFNNAGYTVKVYYKDDGYEEGRAIERWVYLSKLSEPSFRNEGNYTFVNDAIYYFELGSDNDNYAATSKVVIRFYDKESASYIAEDVLYLIDNPGIIDTMEARLYELYGKPEFADEMKALNDRLGVLRKAENVWDDKFDKNSEKINTPPAFSGAFVVKRTAMSLLD